MSNPFYYINVDIDCGKTKPNNIINIDDVLFPNENKKMDKIKKYISKNVDKEYESLSNLDKFVLVQKKFNQTFYDLK